MSLLFAGAPVDIELSSGLAMLLAVFFVFLNGFFVAAEFALVKVRPTQIEPFAARGDRRAIMARHMIAHLDSYLSATQLGITLASLALGWIGEPAFAKLLEPIFALFPDLPAAAAHTISLTVAFSVISIAHIVLGELAPKSLAIRKPEPTSLWVAMPLFAFYKLTFPAIWVLNHAANFLLRLVGIQPVSESELAHSEEEIRRILASDTQSDLSDHKRELLDNVFELSDRVARQIMIPRSDVVYLDIDKPLADNLEAAKSSGHTRFPLCKEDLDHVVGLVHIKDLFRAAEMPTSLEEICHAIAFVPETLTADRLLRRMRHDKVHMAAVLDEYGGVSGIVTLENVIEEIVGEIQDEFDSERPQLVKLGPDTYQVSGSMLIDELEHELAVELSDRDEDTVAGVVLSELGRPAQIGDRVRLQGVEIQVKEIDGNRIRALRIMIAEKSEEAAPAVES